VGDGGRVDWPLCAPPNRGERSTRMAGTAYFYTTFFSNSFIFHRTSPVKPNVVMR